MKGGDQNEIAAGEKTPPHPDPLPPGAREIIGKDADRPRSMTDNRPMIHYVFRPENTYETEFRGKRAIGVRDLGKGEPAELVILETFEPYERAFLKWDPDWAQYKSNWLDLAVNIIGFVPFGVLLMLALSKEGTRDEGVGTSAAQRQERRSQKPTADSQQPAATRQENPPASPFAKGGGVVVAVVLAVVAGFVVSLAIEYLQAYLPSRDSSVRDFITNVFGTAIGAIAAAWLVRRRGADCRAIAASRQ